MGRALAVSAYDSAVPISASSKLGSVDRELIWMEPAGNLTAGLNSFLLLRQVPLSVVELAEVPVPIMDSAPHDWMALGKVLSSPSDRVAGATLMANGQAVAFLLLFRGMTVALHVIDPASWEDGSRIREWIRSWHVDG